jgi:RNA polymerase sigma factor (sigma-70 family)
MVDDQSRPTIGFGMTTANGMRTVIQQLCRSVLLRDDAGTTDGQLLEAFLSRNDNAAVAILVRRHASMVWGVCRRILRNYHEAEDAFQATFLVFARKAASIVPREMIGNWLYGVAFKTALKARVTGAKQKTREKQVLEMPERQAVEADSWQDLERLLDQELNRLPDNYRVAIVLCDLEGKTRKEAARQLGWPEGTVAGRLARARALLAKRLAKQGVGLSGASLSAAFSMNVASATVPSPTLAAALQAVALMATGKSLPVGVLSMRVLVLTERVMKTMFLVKLKAAAAVVVFLLASFGLGLIAFPGLLAAQSDQNSEPTDAVFQTIADLSGNWHGDDWGNVKLASAGKGVYEGTYSDTFGKDVGNIRVSWSAESNRFEGTWSEGTYRFGRVSLRLTDDGKFIRGAYSCDPKCDYKPGIPSLADLQWSRGKSPNTNLGRVTQPGDTFKKTLVDLDRRLWEASAKGDWKTQELLLADDHISVSGHGRNDKATGVASAKLLRCADWVIADVEVRRLGEDAGIITYVYSCKVVRSDGSLDHVRRDHRYTCVWAQRNGNWVMVFAHDSVLPGGE